jgi:EAL domain-containing protein (putative c-di-GMP-specific phosphodiesterase class I)
MIIGLGQNLGLEVIAEGVETEAQLEYMRENGCDVAQGYLYARPESPEDLTPWLAANQRVSETNVRSIANKKRADETGT